MLHSFRDSERSTEHVTRLHVSGDLLLAQNLPILAILIKLHEPKVSSKCQQLMIFDDEVNYGNVRDDFVVRSLVRPFIRSVSVSMCLCAMWWWSAKNTTIIIISVSSRYAHTEYDCSSPFHTTSGPTFVCIWHTLCFVVLFIQNLILFSMTIDRVCCHTLCQSDKKYKFVVFGREQKNCVFRWSCDVLRSVKFVVVDWCIVGVCVCVCELWVYS